MNKTIQKTINRHTINLNLFLSNFKPTTLIRSSHPEVFCKKRVLKYFAKFSEKHLCQNLSFNKIPNLRSGTLLKKRLWRRCFPVNIAKNF